MGLHKPVVYFAQVGADGPIKIGYSSNAAKRITNLDFLWEEVRIQFSKTTPMGSGAYPALNCVREDVAKAREMGSGRKSSLLDMRGSIFQCRAYDPTQETSSS